MEAKTKGKQRVQRVWEYVIHYNDRPKNLRLESGRKGKGCYVWERAAPGTKPPGLINDRSKIVGINEHRVENHSFESIRQLLKTAAPPLRLRFRSRKAPQNAEDQRRADKRKMRKQYEREMSTKSLPGGHGYGGGSRARHIDYDLDPRFRSRARAPSAESPYDVYRGGGPPPPQAYDPVYDDYSRTGPPPPMQPPPPAQQQPPPQAVPVPAGAETALRELEYLKNALSLIHSAVTEKPGPDGKPKGTFNIPYHREYANHFRMLETILHAARLKGDSQSSQRMAVSEADKTFRSTLAKAAPIDQWFHRIFVELRVDQLELSGPEDQCMMTLERICDLKETNQTLRNEVIQMEQLLSSMRSQKNSLQAKSEELKARDMEIGQRVEKVVIKALGLKDRLGSLAKTLGRVEDTRLSRLGNELRLAPIHTTLDMHSPPSTQLEALLNALDAMKSLSRKAELMIREISVQPKTPQTTDSKT